MSSSLPSGAVVVAIDGSEHAERALDWAVVVAEREHRPLLLVHAAEAAQPYWVGLAAIDLAALNESIQEAGERLVRDASARVRETHPAVDVRTHCEFADARDLLVSLSARAHVLVIGSRGRGAVRRILLGSVAAAVTRHATCPVVVLRPHSETSHDGGVLVGIDGTDHSSAPLEFAFRAASWTQSPLSVLHCFWDLTREDQDDVLVTEGDPEYAEERAMVSESMAGLREKYPDVDVRVQLGRGLVDRVMLDLAHGRDLLVVGARSHGALAEAFLGSVATTMLEYAPCPVAVVPRELP